MIVINARSVSEALSQGLHWLRVGGIRQESRVGTVLVSPNPILTVYENPLNRVLFSAMRDANPVFHVMEALWMLAGRNDLPWLGQFNKGMLKYSDDGGRTQPGAYGYRWRRYFGYDQLPIIINELKTNPQTRRCVLTMWDGGDMGNELNGELVGRSDLKSAINGSADVPCNTHAYFDTIDGKLNMTISCRSNDIIWGAYGANAVHFSFLLEYVAAMTGLPMGVYRQFSNNFHLYTNVVPEHEVMPLAREVVEEDRYFMQDGAHIQRVPVSPSLRRVALVTNPDQFQNDLSFFMDGATSGFQNAFFTNVAEPMLATWAAFKAKDWDAATDHCERIKAVDWRVATTDWINRRQIKALQNTERFTDVVPTAQDGGAASA